MIYETMEDKFSEIEKIIKDLPSKFGSDDFIKRFVKNCEADYIQMLTHYRMRQEKGIFQTVHNQIEYYISKNKYSLGIEKEYTAASENIFGEKSVIQYWEKLSSTLKESIVLYIQTCFENARKTGQSQIELRAGDIHKEMGLKDKIPSVCNAMRSIMNDGDVILKAPPKGNGTNVYILYKL